MILDYYWLFQGGQDPTKVIDYLELFRFNHAVKFFEIIRKSLEEPQFGT